MRFFKKWRVLFLFVGLSVFGTFLRYVFSSEEGTLWQLWSSLDVSFAVALGVLAFIAYRDMVRDDDEIRLYFKLPDGTTYDTGLCLLRKDCTRSEVIGVLGMMQRRTSERFHYASEHLHDLLEELNSVQKGRRTELYIPIDEEEFEQFERSAFRKVDA
jgi:predicted membrane channel-forming protein YqfA (hemolysin III family)